MKIQTKTLKKLRELINEETQYRKGWELVEFFNDLNNSNDVYGQGFPSRWCYTDEKLSEINGTPKLGECIQKVFAPINFIEKYDKLDELIHSFNEYLIFDNWQVVREEREINIIETKALIKSATTEENNFLQKDFDKVSLIALELESTITEILDIRLDEIQKCMKAEAYLSSIFLTGSSLEGILLGVASKYPKIFNQSKVSPKDQNGKVKPYYEWTLNNFIDTACDIGFLNEDVKKFSHAVRDFRNYIHPHEQLKSKFNPDKHTAEICWKVLQAAIFQIIHSNKDNCR